jgi:hypothetical protein
MWCTLRYRPNKPSRREVRAALELYKPHNFDGGNMPQIPAVENEELYKPRVCWWTYKGRKLEVDQHICGLPATLYNVSKSGDNCSHGSAVSMYLCDKHAKALKSKGYDATLVTSPPSQPML